MIGVTQAFAPGYARARTQFLEAAAIAGLAIDSHRHPLAGPAGEDLALDAVRDGAPGAERLLIVSSASQGVGGYGGSGVQVFALHDAEWRAQARTQGVAVLYLHALDPYGFAHTRCATHENIALEHNFPDFRQPLPANAAYAALHPLLLPPEWPPSAAHQAALAAHGFGPVEAAVARGQYDFADGLCYGGTGPSWSHRVLRQLLRTHGQGARRIAWIDLRSGPGPSGHGERRFLGGDSEAGALQRARQWWSGSGATPVCAGQAAAPAASGAMARCLPEECPAAETTCLALAWGTLPAPDWLDALRAAQWLQRHPAAPPAQARAIQIQLRAAFYTETDAWKGQAISQARQALFQAAQGLNA